MNWGRETSPRPCTPRYERKFPRIRSLLHMALTNQNDQPQRIERKLLAQTVRTDGQSLSHSRWVAWLLHTSKAHSFVPIPQQTVNGRANCRFLGNLRRTVQFDPPIQYLALHFTFASFIM